MKRLHLFWTNAGDLNKTIDPIGEGDTGGRGRKNEIHQILNREFAGKVEIHDADFSKYEEGKATKRGSAQTVL